ncbi:LuxR family two component transcriptional regulator [Humitalea rosea]|uniref:LuxR family two component transcriptional regulator n=1 Tax=Humitalea rosea TaxID=990373 RepID=A0A2W7IIX2_9PROT|nr:response regulator FixJ [Humitalea rosea]PZW46825.1 LuxR family two component transcriptional regulator [Humitalea rosea]
MTVLSLIHVIDDDEAVRDSLQFLLEEAGYRVRLHGSALAFLDEAPASVAGGCVISDVRMPGMDGLELQAALARRGDCLQLIFMTGHGDVPLAVRALKAGAIDFLEKPFGEEAILAAVESALSRARQQHDRAGAALLARERLATLTPREREVLEALVAGNPNKTIAFDLGLSPRTVEVHRARVMEKMQARSLSELVRLSLAATQG